MRVVIAMLKHETNTFSPIPTDLARFQAWGLYYGDDVVKAYENTNMTLAAYFKLARAAGAEIVTPVAAEAMPSGPVQAAAYEHLCGKILEAVAAGCDAVMLDLHGAMVAESTPDGEGTLLARIREIAPAVPICVTLDLHCNLTEQMVASCDALIGYKTYPHVDMYEVGTQVGEILFRKLRGECDPVMVWRQTPVLSQTLRQGTDDEPMKGLIALAREAEAKDEVLAATVFGGFALADMPDAGTAVICIAERGRRPQADAVADRLAKQVWDSRETFIYQHHPLADAIAGARKLTEGPVLLLDHADNTGSGGTQDVMAVVEEVIRQGLEDVVVGAVWDPQAVKEMQIAGVGSTITVALGGKTDMPTIGEKGRPLAVTGKVKALTDGEWIVRGPMYHGLKVSMGPSALLDTGKVRIVVTSKHHEPWDQGVFLSMGVDPKHARYVLLKSRIHYRAGFAPIARHTITCDGIGVTTSDNRLLDYKQVRRPIYPLDIVNEPN